MGNKVFANGREVSCKAAAGKAVCAFPDVCFTPPQTAVTPPGVPIPYPNTGVAKDTTKGSKRVKISGKEVILKNKSYFKKSTGDEAGSAPKKGVMTNKVTGKVYFNSWSMDVKFEGENVTRHLDLTTHNHASVPGDTPTWPYIDSQALDTSKNACQKEKNREKEACKDYKPRNPDGEDPCPPVAAKPSDADSANQYAMQIQKGSNENSKKCLRARRCMLQPYQPSEKQQGGCCEGQTAHHLVEASSFWDEGQRKIKPEERKVLFGKEKYDDKKAPCVCAEGTGHGIGTHGMLHVIQSAMALNNKEALLFDSKGHPLLKKHKVTSLEKAQRQGAKAVKAVFPESDCSVECLENQLKAYHETECGLSNKEQIRSVVTVSTKETLRKRFKALKDYLYAKKDLIKRAGEVITSR
nr:PAAR-like domain-containing protein [uncultured Desulfobacter sp.]